MRGIEADSAADLLAAWDAGEPVATIELGGLGPGYEQTIHCLVFELLREPDTSKWDAVIDRENKTHHFSGTQVGGATHFAKFLLKYGMGAAKKQVPHRVIIVSRNFPSGGGSPP